LPKIQCFTNAMKTIKAILSSIYIGSYKMFSISAIFLLHKFS
jgi:hypothetical protein